MRQKKLLYSHTSHKYLGLLGILPNIIRFGLFTVIMSMTYVFASCSDETALSDKGDETGSVTFYVGSYATTATRSSTVGSTVIQTDSEAQVNELIAVIFTDVSGGGTSGYSSGQTDTEDDDDTYYGYYTLVGDDGVYSSFVLSTSTEMRIEIDDEGYYQICFVANPSSTIKTAIQNLATASANTIADFKALVETQDPATTPMEMTSSTFYGVYSGQDTDLGAVTLKRIMARIDIVNCVDDLVITKAVFKYRATKSTLMRDNSSDWASDGYSYVSTAQKTYTFSYPLIGNESNTSGSAYGIETTTASKVNASKCEIYSYEQYAVANSSSGKGYIPVIVLYYYLTSDKSSVYTHEVSFKDEGLNIQRNYRYKIQVGYDGDTTISTSIDVDDWNYGTVFEVSDSDIIAGLDGYSPSATLKVGDFIMSDGSYICAADLKDGTITTSDFTSDWYPVAIIFIVGSGTYVAPDRCDEGMMPDARSALCNLHGAALALKNVTNGVNWNNSSAKYYNELSMTNEFYGYSDYSESAGLYISECYADYYGAGETLDLVNLCTTSGSSDAYPAAYKAYNYSESCGDYCHWYLPSIGTWYDIIGTLYSKADFGGGFLTTTDSSRSVGSYYSIPITVNNVEYNAYRYYTSYGDYGYIEGCAEEIGTVINEAMSLVGSKYYTALYSSSSSRMYWCSTEASEKYARVCGFSTSNFYYPYLSTKVASDVIYVRAYLLF